MSDEVYKATITITVMGVAASAQAFQNALENQSLASIMEDADSEDLIAGTHSIAKVEHVHRDDVANELQSIGNDGSFFDYDLDDGDGDKD